MDVAAVTLILAAVFLWGILSARAERAHLSAPIFFVVVGFVSVEILNLIDLNIGEESVKLIAEVTLVLVLFADASTVNLKAFRSDLSTYIRLLGVGLPLTIGLGTVAAMWLLGVDPWAALLLGAALAPTDAALGAAVMTNPSVPSRIRRVLNVESGLNDGIATPIVLVAIAGVAVDAGIEGVEGPGRAGVDLLVGLIGGVLVGVAGGMLTRQARRHGWLSEDFAGPAVLGLALLTYACALLVGANGFVAAFAGGLAFGSTAGRGREKEASYVEQTGGLASAVAWLLFGAVALPVIGAPPNWRVLAYALLSLTVIRMVPVAVSLLGTDIDRRGMAFIGWFGPRGLASVIFALLALEELHTEANELVATIALTILLSVIAHGLTATPLAKRYASSKAATGAPEPDGTPVR
jgi:NhaP-type Na+/H+ or K+/H+ antiporter